MPDRTLMTLLEQGWEIFLPVLLGLIGGAVRIMQADGPCTWRGRLAALSAAGFAGYVLFSLMEAAGVPAGVAGAFTTMSGYVGRPLLDILSSRLCTLAKTAK